jgi:hypothetical protein
MEVDICLCYRTRYWMLLERSSKQGCLCWLLILKTSSSPQVLQKRLHELHKVDTFLMLLVVMLTQ